MAERGHAADVRRSERLQRVLALLSDGREHTTRQIVLGAGVCAVNSIITELRMNGAVIECRRGHLPHGARVWFYQMTKAPEAALMEETSATETTPAGDARTISTNNAGADDHAPTAGADTSGENHVSSTQEEGGGPRE